MTGWLTVCTSCFLNAPDSKLAFAPSFHSIFSARRPFSAAQVLSATTATPPSDWNISGGLGGSSVITSRTPRTLRASASLTLFTDPPTTGGCSIDATTMLSR